MIQQLKAGAQQTRGVIYLGQVGAKWGLQPHTSTTRIRAIETAFACAIYAYDCTESNESWQHQTVSNWLTITRSVTRQTPVDAA
jgi:hypothetical protein